MHLTLCAAFNNICDFESAFQYRFSFSEQQLFNVATLLATVISNNEQLIFLFIRLDQSALPLWFKRLMGIIFTFSYEVKKNYMVNSDKTG